MGHANSIDVAPGLGANPDILTHIKQLQNNNNECIAVAVEYKGEIDAPVDVSMEVRVDVTNKTTIDHIIDNGVVLCEGELSQYIFEIIRFDDDLAGMKSII